MGEHSYAYVLMLLGVLQLRQPPILPCLQQLWHGGPDGQAPRPVWEVDGFDVYFLDDLAALRRSGFNPKANTYVHVAG